MACYPCLWSSKYQTPTIPYHTMPYTWIRVALICAVPSVPLSTQVRDVVLPVAGSALTLWGTEITEWDGADTNRVGSNLSRVYAAFDKLIG